MHLPFFAKSLTNKDTCILRSIFFLLLNLVLRGRLGAFVLQILLRNYIAVEDFFRRHIEDNTLFEDELRDQRRDLTSEYNAVCELYRVNSEVDPVSFQMERWTLEAVEDFNVKAHAFIQNILKYAEMQNELLRQEGDRIRRRLDGGN